jgi:cytochrome c oxidase assembly protein subunit 15
MPYSRAVHGLAVTLTLAVFPLIWVGGLVTTYDAGMAVPDWPNTYGYNMFAYPPSTWLFGPFDLLVEHSHRLLGTVAGLLAIGLVVAAWIFDSRPLFKWWTVFVLLAVIAQGALGGFRVLLDQRSFAMIHGCTGPLFFAIATATAVMSSRWWFARVAGKPQSQHTTHGAARLAAGLLLASYCQLIIGAQLRHITAAVDHRVFMAFVHTHLTLAALVVILAICTCTVTGLNRRTPLRVSFPAMLIAVLVLIQITLGIATWVVNYALPWQELSEWLARYTISAKGYWESLIVTAHMATGSLIISLATVTALRAWRSREPVVAKEVNRKWKQQLA